MTEKKKPEGGGYLSIIRYLVNFLERFFKNAIIQLKWLWDSGKWVNLRFTQIYTAKFGNQPHILLTILVIMIILACSYFLLIPVLFWAALKSI